MSVANLKRHINLYFNPNSLPVSTSGNLTLPPPLLLTFSPPANTLVSLLLRLMKAKVLAESSFIFSLDSLCYANVYRCESGRCRTLPFFQTYSLSSSHDKQNISASMKPLSIWRNTHVCILCHCSTTFTVCLNKHFWLIKASVKPNFSFIVLHPFKMCLIMSPEVSPLFQIHPFLFLFLWYLYFKTFLFHMEFTKNLKSIKKHSPHYMVCFD